MATLYEAVAERTRRFGKNAYLEVARKRLREGDASGEFLVLSRGFYESNGEKRWTKFVTLPNDPEIRRWLAEALAEL